MSYRLTHIHRPPEGSYQPDGIPTAPSPNTCVSCGRRIVFIAGYELRRSYWRATK